MNFQPKDQDLLAGDITMGTVMLKVGDMANMTKYYQNALGLDPVAEGLGGVYLGRGTTPLVHLAPAAGLQLPPSAPPRASNNWRPRWMPSAP